jgi:hypothetical protein
MRTSCGVIDPKISTSKIRTAVKDIQASASCLPRQLLICKHFGIACEHIGRFSAMQAAPRASSRGSAHGRGQHAGQLRIHAVVRDAWHTSMCRSITSIGLPPSAIVLGPSRRHQWHSVPLLTRDSNARTLAETIVFDDTSRVYSTHLKSPPVSRQKDCVEDADLATLWPGQLAAG